MSTSIVQKSVAVAAAAPQVAAPAPAKRSWADVARAPTPPTAPTPPPGLDAQPEAPDAVTPTPPPTPPPGLCQDREDVDAESEGEAQPEDEPLDEVPDEMEPEHEAAFDEAWSGAWHQAGACRPGPRGSRRCFCQGEVLMVLGHYGWIASQCMIDHPDVDKHDGRIYFHRGDIAGGADLAEGDAVDFFLYEDEQGLGAEDIRVRAVPKAVEPLGSMKGWGMNAAAPTFVPTLSAAAPEFVPSAPEPVQAPVKHYKLAFVPIAPVKKAPPPMPKGPNCFAFNIDLLSDSESEDEGSTAGGSSRGASSDSEHSGSPRGLLEPPPGLPVPHGVLLKNFRPPPGLSLC